MIALIENHLPGQQEDDFFFCTLFSVYLNCALFNKIG